MLGREGETERASWCHRKRTGRPAVRRSPASLGSLVPYVVGLRAGALIYGSLYWFPLVNGFDGPYFYLLAGAGFAAAIAVVTWWAEDQEGSSSRDYRLRGFHGLDTGLYVA